MSMRDQALTNIEITMDSVDHRDKVLAVDIAFGTLDDEQRREFVRRISDGWTCAECQPSEWTCDGCLDLVPDGAGYYVNDMRVCERCAEKVRMGDN